MNFGKRFVLDSPRRNSRLRPRPGVLCSPSSPALQQRRKADQPHMISLHFLRGFDMKKNKQRAAPPFFSRIQRKMRQEISACFPCWWAGRGGREETIGTSRPASASPSSSAPQHRCRDNRRFIEDEFLPYNTWFFDIGKSQE